MIPKTHPRYESLLLRDKVKNAFKEGYLADSGMIAHGRGETFDYLIGEKTTETAKEACRAAVATIFLAENPVLSVNGNTTALAIDEIIELAKATDSKIEINLFYRRKEAGRIFSEAMMKNWNISTISTAQGLQQAKKDHILQMSCLCLLKTATGRKFWFKTARRS